MDERFSGPGAFILYAITTAMMIFIMAPLLLVMAASVSDSYFVTFPPQGFTLKWYAKVLGDRDFLEAMRLSILLALGTTAGSLLLGVPAAFALVRGNFFGLAAIKGFLLSPLIFPSLVTGLALLQVLTKLGSQDARLNLLIGHIVVTSPYVIRTVVTSLQLVDENLEDAARTLGGQSATNLLACDPAANRIRGRRGRAVRLHGVVRQLSGHDVARQFRIFSRAAGPDATTRQRL